MPTLIAYGILTIYQPRLDATRAALIYLMEPLFAALYAYVIVGRSLLPIQLVGAATILIANLLVELLSGAPALNVTRSILRREVV